MHKLIIAQVKNMFIRQPPLFQDNLGHPANGFRVYIGTANTDPTVVANRLSLYNGAGGDPIGNPFFINKDGFARNTNGQVIFPWTDAQEYSIEVRSPTGSLGVLFYQNLRMMSDAFGLTPGDGSDPSMVDATYSSFNAALVGDSSKYDLIYIQAYTAAWQGTAAGPIGAFYAYRTGSVGTPSTGHPGEFFDALGNEWKPAPFQRLYVEMFGGKEGGPDSRQAIQDMIDTAIAQEKPAYFDGNLYKIGTGSNTAPNYSLVNKYAIGVTGNVSLIGSGATVLENANADDGQYMFFFENVDLLSIEGLEFNANSITANTGALYLAGVDNVYMDNVDVNFSAPLYFSASTTRQSGTMEGNLSFKKSQGQCISGNSGGFKKLYLNSVHMELCKGGIDVRRTDIDTFSLSWTDPDCQIGNITGDTTGDLFTGAQGSISCDSFIGRCGYGFKGDLVTNDMGLVRIGYFINTSAPTSLTGVCKIDTTNGGIIDRLQFGYAEAYGDNPIIIDNPLQLIGEALFDHLVIASPASSAIVLGDNTQLGTVRIYRGSLGPSLVGFTIGQTNGQNVELRAEVDLTGVTTQVVGWSKSKWSGGNAADTFKMRIVYSGGNYTFDPAVTPPFGWVVEPGTPAEITHNLDSTDYTVVATAVIDNDSGVTTYNPTANSFFVRTRNTSGNPSLEDINIVVLK